MNIFGRHERIDLPDFGYSQIKSKIDTGAYGNALHYSKMKFPILLGRKFLKNKYLVDVGLKNENCCSIQ